MSKLKEQFVTEKLGGCWHEVVEKVKITTGSLPEWGKCSCGGIALCQVENLDLTTWPGFGWMFEKMQASEEWERFKIFCNIDAGYATTYAFVLPDDYTNPTNFLNAVANFYRYEGE